MRFRLRMRPHFGPFRLNFTQGGYSSWSFHLLGWSWNSRTRQWTLNTPGPGSVRFNRRR